MAVNRDRTFFGADGYGFVSDDTNGIGLRTQANGAQQSGELVLSVGAFENSPAGFTRRSMYLSEEFVGTLASGGALGWTATNTGSGFSSVITEFFGVNWLAGVWYNQINGAGSSSFSLGDTNNWLRLDKFNVVEQTWIWYPRTNGAAGSTFLVEYGLSDAAGSNQVRMSYTATGGTDAITARTRNGGVNTDTATGQNRPGAFSGPHAWRMRYENAAESPTGADRVLFYINDVLVATNTTNIPLTNSVRPYCFLSFVSGAGLESIAIDAFSLNCQGRNRY